MFDYKVMSKDQRKWMLYLLVIIALGAIFTPYTRFFLGLLLGTAIRFYNLWLLQRKVYAFGKAVVETGAPLGLGTFTRIVTSVLGRSEERRVGNASVSAATAVQRIQERVM